MIRIKKQTAFLLAGLISQSLLAQQKETRPNIIIILADDLGYSDIGCYGGEIQTPNVDNLAKQGIRFTSFYNCARCCPTRASLLTGKYAQEVGLARNGNNLDKNAPTIAEVLKEAGYHTGMSGNGICRKQLEFLIKMNSCYGFRIGRTVVSSLHWKLTHVTVDSKNTGV